MSIIVLDDPFSDKIIIKCHWLQYNKWWFFLQRLSQLIVIELIILMTIIRHSSNNDDNINNNYDTEEVFTLLLFYFRLTEAYLVAHSTIKHKISIIKKKTLPGYKLKISWSSAKLLAWFFIQYYTKMDWIPPPSPWSLIQQNMHVDERVIWSWYYFPVSIMTLTVLLPQSDKVRSINLKYISWLVVRDQGMLSLYISLACISYKLDKS